MVNDKHVVEPSEVIESVIELATEAVEMIMRIDKYVEVQQRTPFIPPI